MLPVERPASRSKGRKRKEHGTRISRDSARKNRSSRSAPNARPGLIPAVIYREGKPGTNLSIEEKEWKKTLASGQRVVNLKIAGGDRQALIKDVQYDHFGSATIHVDFNELKDGQKVRLAVPVILKGVPKGLSQGGVLTQEMHTLHIECLPNDIPEKIFIDVEALALGQYIHVKEVKFPTGVHAIDHADLVVCAVHEPRGEDAAPAEGEPTELVVLTAKKEEAPAADAGAKAGGPPPKKDAKK